MKNIVQVNRGISPHWVGDGFPVRTVVAPRGNKALGPFIMMDYAGPHTFSPSNEVRGVDTHPHKGFETVTVVFQGELEHRDSAGNSGKIGPGDVQWMTAASGILHQEKHSRDFTSQGGVLEMAQIWVNLPAKDKSATPSYQELASGVIPEVPLAEGNGRIRVIAGAYGDTQGAARTFTPVTLWVVTVDSAGEFALPIPAGQPGGIYVRSGAVEVGGQSIAQAEFAEFSADGEGLRLNADQPSELLILAGEPIDEPMMAYGPFVMNTREEIEEAIREFQAGKYGRIDG